MGKNSKRQRVVDVMCCYDYEYVEIYILYLSHRLVFRRNGKGKIFKL